MISHKLNEIAEIADAVTVIRDGQTVETYQVEAGKVDEDRIIRAMVGRSIENRYPDHTPTLGETIFEVRDWRVEHPPVPGRLVCKDSSFFVRQRARSSGFAGLMGAGRTELARSLFGRTYGRYLVRSDPHARQADPCRHRRGGDPARRRLRAGGPQDARSQPARLGQGDDRLRASRRDPALGLLDSPREHAVAERVPDLTTASRPRASTSA